MRMQPPQLAAAAPAPAAPTGIDVPGDLVPIFLGCVLFALLSPGTLFQFPGQTKWLEFRTMKNNFKAVAFHGCIFAVLLAVIVYGCRFSFVVHLRGR